MGYFFARLVVFVIINFVVLVIVPIIFSSRATPPDWLFSFLSMSVIFAGLFSVLFGIAELLRKLPIVRARISSPPSRDALFSIFYMLGCLLFLFTPRPGGFSFGDGVGMIIEDGNLTTYGWQVQLMAFRQCVLVAILFWSVCRLGLANTSKP
jgi:hypothetical protein